MSRADKVLITAFLFGTAVVVALDDGKRFLGGFLGLFALVFPLGLGMLLFGVGFEAKSYRMKCAAFACGLASLVGAWAVERNATLANDAFMQVAEGVSRETIPFLRDVEPGERVLRGAAANATYMRAPTGEVRTLVWSDWVGNSYAVTFDVENDAVVSTLHIEFQRGVIGASYLVVVAAGFVVGLVVFPTHRYFARKRELSPSGKGV